MENTFIIDNGKLTKAKIIVNGNIILPPHITSIDPFAFSNCKKLLTIVLSPNIVEINEWAFNGCVNLKSIIFSDKITIIKEGVFCDCKSLRFITLPNNIKEIHSFAFYGCYSLNSIIIPYTVRLIGNSAFYIYTNVKIKHQSNFFITWSLKVMRNRTNWKITSIGNCHNLLRLITDFTHDPKRTINYECFGKL